jgi:hypothetical protein
MIESNGGMVENDPTDPKLEMAWDESPMNCGWGASLTTREKPKSHLASFALAQFAALRPGIWRERPE